MSARQWWATPASKAPMLRHLMPDSDPVPHGSAYALCGEYRRRWQRVETFAVPEALTECADCLRLGGRTVQREGNPS